MLARSDGQRGFVDAAWCAGLLPERSIYALLAERGERIVCDEDFAECYSASMGVRRSRFRTRPRGCYGR